MEHVSCKNIAEYQIVQILAGSRMYGTAHAKSDYDIRGVFIPSRPMRNDPFGDDKVFHNKEKDVAYYALRHFIYLCANGNPNTLELLYAPAHNVLYKNKVWDVLTDEKGNFLTKRTLWAFLKYAEGQRKETLASVYKPQQSKRQANIQAFGYDTKAAMNTIRLAQEFLMIDTSGKLQFPLPLHSMLQDVLNGTWSLKDFEDRSECLLEQCQERIGLSNLPAVVDTDHIVNVYLEMLELWN